jgi:hypothetical protein
MGREAVGVAIVGDGRGWEAPVDSPDTDRVLGFKDEVVEMGVLLAAEHAAALEAKAHRLGLTTGQLIRGLVRDFLKVTQGNSCRLRE